MATKHTAVCLQNAGDEEPIFVLRAQDELAPGLVRDWAERFRNNHEANGSFNVHIESKYWEARGTAEEMEKWRSRKIPD